jgi:hypothetical protein
MVLAIDSPLVATIVRKFWPIAEIIGKYRWHFGQTIAINSLGGHLKTGHTRTLQNRPTEQNQNKTIYTLREDKLFWGLTPPGLY